MLHIIVQQYIPLMGLKAHLKKESPGNERAKNIKEAINQPLLLNKC